MLKCSKSVNIYIYNVFIFFFYLLSFLHISLFGENSFKLEKVCCGKKVDGKLYLNIFFFEEGGKKKFFGGKKM